MTVFYLYILFSLFITISADAENVTVITTQNPLSTITTTTTTTTLTNATTTSPASSTVQTSERTKDPLNSTVNSTELPNKSAQVVEFTYGDLIGSNCDTNSSCDSIENSVCKEDICQCQEEYVPNLKYTMCLNITKQLGEPCEINKQCEDLKGRCENNVCVLSKTEQESISETGLTSSEASSADAANHVTITQASESSANQIMIPTILVFLSYLSLRI